MSVCMRACVGGCVCVHVRVCVCLCVCVCVYETIENKAIQLHMDESHMEWVMSHI